MTLKTYNPQHKNLNIICTVINLWTICSDYEFSIAIITVIVRIKKTNECLGSLAELITFNLKKV